MIRDTARIARALALFAALSACFLGCSRSTGPAGQPPHVVLILIDTFRVHYTAPFGAERDVTPFLTRLSAESALLPRSFSTSSWTAPATASLFTALYPWQHGVIEGFFLQVKKSGEEADTTTMSLRGMPADRMVLGEHFRELGYSCFGLASNVNIGSELGFDRGFDRFEKQIHETASDFHDRLVEWKDEIDSGGPSFVYVHLNDVHGPHDKREEFYEAPSGKATEMQEHRALYLSEMGYVDQQIERIYELLGRRENTLFVVVSDHGQEFGDHGDFGHGPQLHDELNRVQLLIHGPDLDVQAARIDDIDASLIDVLPTLLDFAGAPLTEFSDGKSLRPLLNLGPTASGLRQALSVRPALSHRRGKGDVWSAVLDRWRYIDNRGEAELYDQRTDPQELNNVIELYPDIASRLAAALDVHRSSDVMEPTPMVEIEVDDELAEELRTLGYVN